MNNTPSATTVTLTRIIDRLLGVNRRRLANLGQSDVHRVPASNRCA